MDKTASKGAGGTAGAPGSNGSTPADFGRWLQAFRHKQRFSQRSLAEALGYDVTYIAKIEGGARPPTRQFFARLAQVTGVPEQPLLHASADDIARPPLPHPPDIVVGRERELDDVVARLTTGARCVTLVGPPGIGKTRLATEVASRLDGVFLSGVWWVSLVDVVEPDSVVHRVRRELGVANRGEADPVNGLVERLRSHQALLVLDNFEHVIAAGSLVSALVQAAPSLCVLVTSREPLGLVSEHVYPVGPLAYPDLATSPPLEDIISSTAVRLFVARARMADPRFTLSAENCEAVARTCAHLDGIPLALILAAGETRTEGIAGIERLARHHSGWASSSVDLPPHHQTLDAAIASSWHRLDPDEARLFARMAVFRGGFTHDAAAAVGEPPNPTERMTARLLDGLTRKSLLEPRPDTLGGVRFDLLETIRAFALDRLVESGEFADARRRHLDFFSVLAESSSRGLLGHEQARSIHVLAEELDNVRAAYEWAVAGNDPAAALRLASSMWRFFLVRDIPAGCTWLDRALEAAPEPTPTRAEGLAAAGALAWVTGNPQMSEALLDEALKLAALHEAHATAALAWLNKGALGEQRDKLDEADRCFVEALRIYESLDDDRGRACALVGRGMIRRRRGEIEAACDCWITAARLFAAVGDRFNQAMALGNLAWAAEQEGRLDEAQEWLGESRRMQIALGDARGLAATTAGLARLAYKARSYDAAASLSLEALVGFQRLGDRPWAAATLVTLAAALARLGNGRRALRLVGAADGLWDLIGSTPRAEDTALRGEVIDACGDRVTSGEAARAIGAGRTMTLDDAVQFAREQA